MLMWLHVCHDVWPTRRVPSIVSLSVHHDGETLPPDAEPAARKVEEVLQGRTGFRLARKKQNDRRDLQASSPIQDGPVGASLLGELDVGSRKFPKPLQPEGQAEMGLR